MPAKRKAALMDFYSTVSTGGVIGIFLANGPTGVGSSNQSGDYPEATQHPLRPHQG